MRSVTDLLGSALALALSQVPEVPTLSMRPGLAGTSYPTTGRAGSNAQARRLATKRRNQVKNRRAHR